MSVLSLLSVCAGTIALASGASLDHRRRDPPPLFPSKLVHLDLKGAPLNISYMEEVFPLLKAMGATGVLVEYEDMFPYTGRLRNLTARNHYTRDEIKRLLDAADENELNVIPLVQTFGHLEFALKLPDYMALREDPTNPQVVCPSYNPSQVMIKHMLRQVAELHKGRISHLHIGSDEVFVLGECSRCKARMRAHNWTTDDLFLDHVYTIAKYAKSLNLQPIMWDDMFRSMDVNLLKAQKLSKIVEIMVWDYGGVGQSIVDDMAKYSQVNFPGVWVASGFKGAVGPTVQMPQYNHHLSNNIDWVRVSSEFKNKLNLKGIAITGWQRYDHFASLCELFPSGIPVLALVLKFIDTGSYDAKALADIQQLLQCNNPIPLSSPDDAPLMWCKYPGAKTFVAVQQLDQVLKKRASLESTNKYKGWLSVMNVKHNFSSPSYVTQATTNLPAVLTLLKTVSRNIQDLRNVTDRFTVKEWMETYWQPQMDWAQSLKSVSAGLLAQQTFPRRPLYK